jgi:ATP-dependent Clp protease ATP-binding subunit ClpX
MTDKHDKENLTCGFCGKKRFEVKKLIAGPNSYICNECISISYKIINDEEIIEEFDFETIPTPQEIKAHLDETVISQEYAKEVLSVCAYNHYKKIYYDAEDIKLEKSNVIMIGSTGTGKTLLAQTLAEMLKVPFTIADATTLTEAGYVGEDVESVLERLLNACDWNVDVAQKGIVFIDEIDKKARSKESNASTKDISGEGVQQALLRLIEGTTVKVTTNGSKRMDQFIDFDTSNVLFICSGAFVGLESKIKNRMKVKKVGFNSDISKNKLKNVKWQDNIDQEDLISYGLIPELVGRLPNLVTLDELTEDDMVEILDKSKASVIPQVKKLLEYDEIELSFEPQYIKDIAKMASKTKTGARGLKSIIENSLHNIMFRAPKLKENGVKNIFFKQYPTKSVDTYPTLVYTNGNEKIDSEYKIKLRGKS